MPHKHTRSGLNASSSHDLPPTSLARPLPTYKSEVSKPTSTSKHSSKISKPSSTSEPKRKRLPKPSQNDKEYKEDDTPRAFTRLVNYRPPPRSGLDDGEGKRGKKRKRDADSTAAPPQAEKVQAVGKSVSAPHILPGESMSSFSARVDAALPVRGLTAKGKKAGIGGVRERQTKTERKMQKMQREWREVETRRKAKRQEAEEDAEDDSDEDRGAMESRGKKGKKVGRSKDEDDEDPWAGIGVKPLQEDGEAGLVGVHDVVLAPPKLKKMREVKDDGFGGKKGASMGLKRQAELGDARRAVVERYREIMKEKGRSS